MNGGETIGVREDDKEEKDKLREMFGPYECKVGGGCQPVRRLEGLGT